MNKLILGILWLLVLSFIVAIGLNTTISPKSDTKKRILQLCEYVYMEAQIDALNKDFAIKAFTNNNGNTDYGWTKTPWDGDRMPKFNTFSEYQRARAEFLSQ